MAQANAKKKKKPSMTNNPNPRRHKVSEVAEHSAAMRKIQERFPAALTVVDATQEKILLVSDVDVQKGIARNPAECAVAQCAMREGLGGLIGRRFGFLIQGSEVTRYQLGRNAQVRTAIFDDRGTTSTGPVVLSVPAPYARLGFMAARVNMHKAFARKRRKPKNRKSAANREREDNTRTLVMTQGFRSWSLA